LVTAVVKGKFPVRSVYGSILPLHFPFVSESMCALVSDL